MVEEGFLIKERQREESYKLLADCYHLPDERLAARITGADETADGLRAQITEFLPVDKELEPLTIDFSGLFIGPFKLLAPPYGSVYLEGKRTVMGESTIDVKRRYLDEGLEMGIKEAPDHIAAELEFMYFLIFREMESLKRAEEEAAFSYLKKQNEFLTIHLGAWVAEFTGGVEANAETGFYKNLAHLTRRFIKRDISGLKRALKNSIFAYYHR